MLKQLTYKQWVKFLPVVFIMALLLVYWLAIHETFALRQKCKELTTQSVVARDAPKQMARLRNRVDELNKMMGRDTLDSESDPLLKFATGSSNYSSIRLVDFQPLHIFQHQNYQIETRVAVFEGTFVNLVKFLYNLEQGFSSGKVVSVKFQTETNYKTNKKRLLMTLFVQSVKNGTGTTPEGMLTQTK